MNDFTKEELNILRAALHEILFFSETPKLLNKIQSMIDNYCEHEWENICCQCDLDKIYCYKCEKTLNE